MELQRHVPRHVRCGHGADLIEQQAIYKPVRGERPLWDFEPGLHQRERAAYLLSERLGVGVVPPTVIRDGPLGEGSLQWFVDADHSEHYFTIHEQFRRPARSAARDRRARRPRQQHRPQERPLPARATIACGAIDNGLCFAAAVQAAHRHLGVRRRADRRRAAPSASPASSTACRSTSPRCSTTTRSMPCNIAPTAS